MSDKELERARELVDVLEDIHARVTEPGGGSAETSDLRAELRRAVALARANRDALREQGEDEPEEGSATLNGALSDELRRLCIGFRSPDQCEIDFRLGGDVQVDGLAARVLYETTRDLLEAFIDRGDADRVKVSLRNDDGVTILAVRDEATGFNPATVGPGQLELHELRERVDAIGGQVSWEASWEEGTCIEIHV